MDVLSAADFLRQVLADGLTPCKTVEAEAKEAGVSWATVRRAADSLCVIKTKGVGAWYWKLPSLPPQGAQLAQDAHGFDVERLEHLGEQVTQGAHQLAQDLERERLEQVDEHLG